MRSSSAEKSCHTVRKLCRVVRVSPSVYYLYACHDILPGVRGRGSDVTRIRAIHKGGKSSYGVPRILAELRGQGIRSSQKPVARLMRALDITGYRPAIQEDDHRRSQD